MNISQIFYHERTETNSTNQIKSKWVQVYSSDSLTLTDSWPITDKKVNNSLGMKFLTSDI